MVKTTQTKLGKVVTKSLRGPFRATLPASLESRPTPSMASAFGGKLLQVFAISVPPHPFVCPKCQGTMSVVAIIEDPKELTKIIDWASQQKREQPETVCARSPPELALVSV
jgi:hypothetical protein